MSYWMLLADPKTYGFDRLVRDKSTAWDGITGSLAQKHMRGFKKGDMALIYHTAPDKAVVGSAKIASGPYSDPKQPQAKLVVVDVQPLKGLKKPVLLAALRENKKLAGMAFLKIQRIAVSPLTKAEFDEILRMGQG